MRWISLLVPLWLGCAEKQAADPHEMLADDYRQLESEPGEPAADPGLEPATRAECQTAIEHLHALAGAATKTGSDVKPAVDECLARGTSRREARCIARIRSESEIDRCANE